MISSTREDGVDRATVRHNYDGAETGRRERSGGTGEASSDNAVPEIHGTHATGIRVEAPPVADPEP
jgi:hypothetical protein